MVPTRAGTSWSARGKRSKDTWLCNLHSISKTLPNQWPLIGKSRLTQKLTQSKPWKTGWKPKLSETEDYMWLGYWQLFFSIHVQFNSEISMQFPIVFVTVFRNNQNLLGSPRPANPKQVKTKSWFGLHASLRDALYDWTIQEQALHAMNAFLVIWLCLLSKVWKYW